MAHDNYKNHDTYYWKRCYAASLPCVLDFVFHLWFNFKRMVFVVEINRCGG